MEANTIDLWTRFITFLDSNTMKVINFSISSVGLIVTIIGFIITIFVYRKLKNINRTMKKIKIVEGYRMKYEKLLNIINTNENVPTDIYLQVNAINGLLFGNIDTATKSFIEKEFAKIAEPPKGTELSDAFKLQIGSFLNDTLIMIGKEISP